MENKVFLDSEGIIEAEYIGPQDARSVLTTGESLSLLSNRLRSSKQKVLISFQIDKITNIPISARAKALESLIRLDFDKIAITTTNLYLKYLAKFVVETSGKAEKISFFNNQGDAIKWLKQ